MAASDRLAGIDMKVLWIHSGGTADLSGNWRTLDVVRDSQMVDATAANDGGTYSKFLRQINGATLTSIFDGTAGSATMGSASIRGTEGTLLYGVEGTATGDPKGGFPAVVKSANLSHPYDGMVMVTVVFDPQGAELFNPQIDVW